ncbi:MAG TPA: NADP-dependent oxidoreductase [Actinomycetota bacterium]
MRAFALDSFGEPGSMRELPTPGPVDGQVLVRVCAAGVNPFDAYVAGGYAKDVLEHRFPLVPGHDAAGVVEAVGDGVEQPAVGDEVFGAVGKPYLGEGTYAEMATMSAATLWPKPAPLDFTQAAAVPLSGATALTLLDAVALGAGERLLVLGASGGVGSYLVQLAARRGARVVGVCSGPNLAYARGLGADDVIDYTTAEVGEAVRSRDPDGVDAIVDLVGDKPALSALSEQLRPGGRVASAVDAADVEQLAKRGIRATNVASWLTSQQLGQLSRWLEDGTLRLPEIHAVAFEDAAGALARIATRHTRGKLVLTVS